MLSKTLLNSTITIINQKECSIVKAPNSNSKLSVFVRKILPHFASFHGYPIKIKVVKSNAKNGGDSTGSDGSGKKPEPDFVVDTHTNESVGSVKRRIAEMAKCSEDQVRPRNDFRHIQVPFKFIRVTFATLF